MKRILIISSAFLALVGGFTAFLGFSPNIEKEIAAGLEAGDSEKIAVYFANQVEFSSPETDDLFSKPEAKKRLSVFFKKHPAVKYTTKHGGKSKGQNAGYMIGELETKDGIYRVNIFLKNALIEQLSFTKEKEKQLNF